MEPVERAGNAAERVADEITPLDVRELVEEHRATTAVGPLLGARRQHNRWLDHATSKRHLDQWAREQSRYRVKVESIGDLAKRRRPGALVEHAARTHDAPHG